MAAEQLKHDVLAALSMEEVVKLIYNKCPSYGERLAFVDMFKSADSTKAIKYASEKARLFKDVHEMSSLDGCPIADRLQEVIMSYKNLYLLAKHPNSSSGEEIDEDEYQIVEETLLAAGYLVSDAMHNLDMLHKRYKTRLSNE